MEIKSKEYEIWKSSQNPSNLKLMKTKVSSTLLHYILHLSPYILHRSGCYLFTNLYVELIGQYVLAYSVQINKSKTSWPLVNFLDNIYIYVSLWM